MKQSVAAAQAAKPNLPTEAKVEIIHVTPELALEFLQKNFKNNRRLNKQLMQRLTRDIRNGAWRKDVLDPIRFNTEGELIDGQHRLTAIMQTSVPLDLLVVRDVDPESVHVIDTGKTRNPSDMLKVAGFTNTHLLASALRALAILKRGAIGLHTSADVSHSFLRELAQRHPLMQVSCGKVRAIRGVRPSLVVLMHYIGTHLLDNPDEADAFMSVFNTGIPTYPGDVAQLYREKLLRDAATPHVKTTQMASLIGMVNTWNHFCRKTVMQQIKLPKEVIVAGLNIDLI